MTSEARARARDEEEAMDTRPASSDPGDEPTGASDADSQDAGTPGAVSDDGGDAPGRARRPARRLLLALGVLLVLLLGAVAFLWLTRPEPSAVRYGDHAQALTAARSGVVDLTSFDYLTLDDDIEQIRRVATGDLRDDSVAQLDERRQEITEMKAVSNTEVVGAGVTRVDGDEATALLLIQSTQESTASPQAQIVRYRIEVTLEKDDDDRWLLSGIKGTETAGDD